MHEIKSEGARQILALMESQKVLSEQPIEVGIEKMRDHLEQLRYHINALASWGIEYKAPAKKLEDLFFLGSDIIDDLEKMAQEKKLKKVGE
jgi:hypothetical protein